MSIERSAGTLSAPYRYMFDSLRERAAVLDELICKGTDLITTRLDNNDLMDIRMTQVWIRVYPDSGYPADFLCRISGIQPDIEVPNIKFVPKF